MNQNCYKSVFNSLSKSDRIKLQGAAFSKAITGVIRDDTKNSPWKYPIYMAYLLCVSNPIVPGGVVLLAGTGIWLKYSKSDMAIKTNERIKDSFNKKNLIKDYKNHIIADDNKKNSYKVKSTAGLVWETSKAALKDAGKASAYAAKALSRQFF